LQVVCGLRVGACYQLFSARKSRLYRASIVARVQQPFENWISVLTGMTKEHTPGARVTSATFRRSLTTAGEGLTGDWLRRCLLRVLTRIFQHSLTCITQMRGFTFGSPRSIRFSGYEQGISAIGGALSALESIHPANSVSMRMTRDSDRGRPVAPCNLPPMPQSAENGEWNCQRIGRDWAWKRR
jgi:hypothetical protein